MKKIAFVIGTGRCATKSFAYLLNEQDRVKAEHELILCKWIDGEEDIFRNIKHLYGILENENVDLAIAVGLYFLPYIEELILKYDIQCVCLKRDKAAVIKSYRKKLNGRNYFSSIYQDKWEPWNLCYPKFDKLIEINDGIKLFYDNYYAVAKYLEEKYPDNFLICHVPEVLYEKEYQKFVLKFIGIKTPKVHTGIKLNALIQKLREIRWEPSSIEACKCDKVYI